MARRRSAPRARGLTALAVGLALVADLQPTAAWARATRAVGAPIERVLVFSQHARVVRRARVRLPRGGADTRLWLIDLPTAVLRSSLRVGCATATLRRVETQRVRRALPRQARARALIGRTEALLRRREALGDERALVTRQLRFLDGLGLASVSGQSETRRRDTRQLHLDAWRRVLDWTAARSRKLRARLLVIAKLRRGLHDALDAVARQAREVQNDVMPDAGRFAATTSSGSVDVGRGALRVTVTLRGRAGAHALTLSYLVGSARWLPSYDLRPLRGGKAVRVTLYARVRQRSGEDWRRARLRFSTTRAVTRLWLPRLPTWTIGRRRDPRLRPRPRRERRARRWRPARPTTPMDPVLRRLRRVVARRHAGPKTTTATKPTLRRQRRPSFTSQRRARWGRRLQRAITNDLRRLGRHSGRTQLARARDTISALRRDLRQAERLLARARRDKDIVKLRCITDKHTALRAHLQIARRALRALRTALRGGGRDARLQALATSLIVHRRAASLAQEARACVGDEIAYIGGTRVDVTISPNVATALGLGRRARRAPLPRERLPFADVRARTAPLSRDLPAAAASGYRATLYAPGRHSVAASGVERCVAIFTRALAVTPLHRLVPGRSRVAFLVGRASNTTGLPLLRGHANLYAGRAFVGRSWLDTALPGAALTLPLGVDDAVKVSRFTRQRTAVRGVLFEDDVTRYRVTVEVANNHRRPINVEVVDQVPLPRGAKIALRRYRSRSGFSRPDAEGRVRWRGRVAARSVAKLSFEYELVRPAGWRLRQHGG